MSTLGRWLGWELEDEDYGKHWGAANVTKAENPNTGLGFGLDVKAWNSL